MPIFYNFFSWRSFLLVHKSIVLKRPVDFAVEDTTDEMFNICNIEFNPNGVFAYHLRQLGDALLRNRNPNKLFACAEIILNVERVSEK